MDLYVVSARRPVRHRVSSHLEPGSFEPEPPFHAAARGQDRLTLCGESIEGPLFAFPDSPFETEAPYARCTRCEATAR